LIVGATVGDANQGQAGDPAATMSPVTRLARTPAAGPGERGGVEAARPTPSSLLSPSWTTPGSPSVDALSSPPLTAVGAAVQRISQWCRSVRHWRIPEQHRQLGRKLRGHYAYYGIIGNSRALQCFRYEVERIWRRWLATRSWHARRSWQWFHGLLERHPLPPAIVVHSVMGCAAKL